MGFTAIEKILMNHSTKALKSISPGDIVTCIVDYVGIHEGVDARGFEKFEAAGEYLGVFDQEKVGVYLGHHFCSAHSGELAANQKYTREWAAKLGVKVFDFGSGIAHIVIMEKGYAYPGSLSVYGDSHATGYGAVGAMGTECGEIILETFLTGKMWFKVPVTHKYIIEGKTQKGVYPRDVIQYIIKQVGMDASVYAALEWDGSYIHSLPVPLRFPFTFMSLELGGKTSFIEPDQITLDYVKGRVKKPFTVVKSDPGVEFEKTFKFDVSKLEPQVCAPSTPANTKPIAETLGAHIDQVCIGTCTGGSIYDMREAAKILKGRKVTARTLIIPGTAEVLAQCGDEGLVKTFIDAGCLMYPPYCGTCQTLSIGHLSPGETQMHSGPRNWEGRTAEGSFTYLGSPATCAATAINGKITDPREYL